MSAISDILTAMRKQPVAVAAAVRAIAAASGYFGFHLNVAEVLAELAALEAVSGVIVWKRVTPLPKIPKDISSLIK